MTRARRSAPRVDAGVGGPIRRQPHHGSFTNRSDPLLVALARFVQALHERYPDGPEQLRREALASGANMPTVTTDRQL